jgi:gluconokinase
MPGACVLAVDVGSSAVRAAVYDADGRAIPASEVRHEYRPSPAGEAHGDALMRLTVRSISASLRASRREIAGVGFSTFWHGLVAADADGRALTPVYLWSDTRSAAAAESLRARVDAEAVRQRTGCPIHASYWPAKLAWLREERPDLWRRRVLWLSFGDLLFQRLFGRAGSSVSMASGTGLFTLDGGSWDGELMRELHVDLESLPPVAESDLGLAPEYGRRWPQLAGVPWFHALGDGALANVGSGCTTPARRAVTVGTSAALRVMDRTPARTPIPAGLWRYRLDAARTVTGGALSSGGNVREWLVRTLAIGDGDSERTVRTTRPAAHGLTVLPHLAGERGLGYAGHAFGAIAGLTLTTTPEQIAQAGLESVAIELARVNRRLDEAAPRARTLVASGGAVLASPAWMQMLADATGVPVAAGRAREASCRGAALFVLERLGLAKPAALYLGATRVFRPRRAAAAAFAAATARQEELYRALMATRG